MMSEFQQQQQQQQRQTGNKTGSLLSVLVYTSQDGVCELRAVTPVMLSVKEIR